MSTTYGSLCSGYGGLDLAVEATFGAELAWHAEWDDAPAAVHEHHWPDVPNLRDLTAVDWTTVAPVDVLCAGYPCQPFSTAGRRQGTEDDRHLWPYIADAVRVLRPRWVVLENVAGHLSLGFDRVLADLAALGFDAEWATVRASDVGAPHRRERLFVVAADTDERRHGGRESEPAATGRGRQGRVGRAARAGQDVAADASHLGHEWSRHPRDRRTGPADGGGTTTDADRAGFGGEPRPQARRDALHGDERGHVDGRCAERERATQDADGATADARSSTLGEHPRGSPEEEAWPRCGDRPGDHRRERPALDWRATPYAPAVSRWERLTGRTAPHPAPDGRLSPAFVEWMMGLPAGWVTGRGLSRTAELKMLGNGVVPQQATAAIAMLLARFPVAVAA